MWEKIIKNRYENVLILEDDVDIDNNFENKLNDYYEQIRKNKDWELMKGRAII